MLVEEQILKNTQCSKGIQNNIGGVFGQRLGEESFDQAARRGVPVSLACLKRYQLVELGFSSFHNNVCFNKDFCQLFNLIIIE